MLHPSHYLFSVELDSRRSLLVNGLNGAAVKLDYEVASGIMALRDSGTSDGYGARLSDERVVTEMRSKGILTELSAPEERALLDERVRRLVADRIRKADAGFWIVPSLRCNLRCEYCYMFSPPAGVKRQLDAPAAIPSELIQAAFSAMDAIQPDCSRRTLTLIGGEPLQPATQAAVRDIAHAARERAYRISVVTNGVSLSEFEDLLSPDAIASIQVVFDGAAALHDARRIGPLHHSTFDLIAANVTRALNRGISVSARIQVDRAALDTVRDLCRTMWAFEWPKSPRFSASLAPLRPSDLPPDAITDWLRALGEREETRFLQSSKNRQDQLLRQRVAEGPSFGKPVYCGKQFGNYLFDPAGRIYDCPCALGYLDEAIGEYGPWGYRLNAERVAVSRRRTVSEIPECAACPYALLCGGGCEFLSRAYDPRIPKLPYRPACEGCQSRIRHEVRSTAMRFDAFTAWGRHKSNTRAVRTQAGDEDAADA